MRSRAVTAATLTLLLILTHTASRSGGALASGPHRGLSLAPGDPAPSLGGYQLVGRMIRVKWSDHPVTLVNFWATWSEPCRDEMPALQALFARRAKDGLAVVGVLVDTVSKEDGAAFAQRTGAQYPIVFGDSALAAAWGGVSVLPVSYLVKRDGTIARRYVGGAPELTRSLLRDAESLLDGRPLGTIEAPAESAPPS